MSEFLTTDNVALYGAIVATIAMLITLGQLYISIQDKKVRLKVSYHKHPDYDENIKDIGNHYDIDTGTASGTSGEAYFVNVNNISNIDIYIKEIFGISKDNVRYDTLIQNGNLFQKISIGELIKSKSYKVYSIYFKEDSRNFELKECYVIDGNNKKWKAKLNTN